MDSLESYVDIKSDASDSFALLQSDFSTNAGNDFEKRFATPSWHNICFLKSSSLEDQWSNEKQNETLKLHKIRDVNNKNLSNRERVWYSSSEY